MAHRILLADDSLTIQKVVELTFSDAGYELRVVGSGDKAVEALLDKRLTGFGELFPMLSYAEVGAAAMLSRAQGGVVQGRALFSLPGSPNACRLALEKLILPELGHVLREVRR